MKNINTADMDNISMNGLPLTLLAGEAYITIDALYVNDIRDYIIESNAILNDIQAIKTVVFPYNDIPFAQFIADKSSFDIKRIKKIRREESMEKARCFFSSDTGVLLFIQEKILMNVLNFYDYDKLVDDPNEIFDIKYWRTIASKFDFGSLGMILSPGINTDFDFDGGGRYSIV